MGNLRNKNAGNKWELDSKNYIKHPKYFPYIETTRNCSRWLDAQKIDLANPDEHKHGKLEYLFQCKTLVGKQHYEKFLEEIEDRAGFPKVFLHRKTEKRGDRFFTVAELAVMTMKDFVYIAHERKKYELGFKLLQEFFDSIDDEFKPEVHKKLEDLGL